jgi:hypothetical protein
MNIALNPRLFVITTFLIAALQSTALVQAQTVDQTAPLPLIKAQPVEGAPTYEARQITRRDVHKKDPNIYAYSAEFARRFLMPEQWIAPDLQGAEAVAFRVVSSYRTCGWGGNPNACKDNETECRLDVYFDHTKQPLPWDERMPSRDFDRLNTSASFVQGRSQPIHRPLGFLGSSRDPFVDSQTGNELRWQYYTGGWGYAGILAYDKEIFKNMSVITFGPPCSKAMQEIWLGTQGKDLLALRLKGQLMGDSALRHFISFPSVWQARVDTVLQALDKEQSQFFKQVYETMQKPNVLPAPSASQ